jgi:hypothetical protein
MGPSGPLIDEDVKEPSIKKLSIKELSVEELSAIELSGLNDTLDIIIELLIEYDKSPSKDKGRAVSKVYILIYY